MNQPLAYLDFDYIYWLENDADEDIMQKIKEKYRNK